MTAASELSQPDQDPAVMAMDALIDRSSLGTTEAKAARASVEPELGRRIVEASCLMEVGGIWQEIAYERGRAHLKHGEASVESLPTIDPIRLTVLMEEVGNVAREFNEAGYFGRFDHAALRQELVQVAATAGAWADALTEIVDDEAEQRRLTTCADCPHGRADHISAYGEGCYACACLGWRGPEPAASGRSQGDGGAA